MGRAADAETYIIFQYVYLPYCMHTRYEIVHFAYEYSGTQLSMLLSKERLGRFIERHFSANYVDH